ncbi:MAG: shikimate dehydrogenase [Bryobacterales bacterium]|nr:shikimate dehydrogenase [Bryobacterales bacterium]
MRHSSRLPKICVALGFPATRQLLDMAEREIESGSRFFEFRLDFLEEPETGIDAIRDLLRRHPEVKLLATCRRHQNHGRFNGSIEEQVSILERAAGAGAIAVDVEIESAETAQQTVDRLRNVTDLIVSYHSYSGTPQLEKLMVRMQRAPADGYKVVTTARKPSDLLRLLSMVKEKPGVPLILLSMGEIGFPSRVLSVKMGCLYSYAAPNSAQGTAPGQISSEKMRSVYAAEKLNRDTSIYGLIACPVKHSISPQIHNRALQSRRINGVYVPFLVDTGQLKDFMQVANELPLKGFNVTIPHKQKILRYLDVVDPLARRIGAVNTVWKKAGKWRGTTTDVAGTLRPLKDKVKLRGARILIAGSGGAARTAAFALGDAGAQVFLTGRNLDKVRALAKLVNGRSLAHDEAERQYFDVLVHATPLGMYPYPEGIYFPDKIPADVVFDMVYNPRQTLLLQRAAEQGKVCMDGLRMLIEQAAEAFTIWTGEEAPRSVMEAAAIRALETDFAQTPSCQENHG